MSDPPPPIEDRAHVVLAVTIAFLAASSFFIILRFVSRIGIVKRVSADDYAIIVAWLVAFGFSFSICYGTSVGLGRHQNDVKPQWEHSLKKSEYAFSVLYNPALMATKTSICLFYLTLSKNQRVFRWTTLCTLAVVNVAGTALTLLNIFQCRPVPATFDFPMPPADKCIDIVTLYLSSAPVNIITDLALLFLPMPILTGMKLPRNEKLILIVTFSFGAFVAVIDVVRIAYLQSAALAQLQKHTGSDVGATGDFSWVASLSFMWSAVEVHMGIIVACVPGVKPLAVKIFPTLLGRIKHVGDLTGSHYYGPGDAQWANMAPPRLTDRTYSGHGSLNPANRPRSKGHDRGMGVDGMLGLPNSNESGTAYMPTCANGISHSDQVGNTETLDFLTTPETAHTQEAKACSGHRDDSMNMLDFLTSPGAVAPTENTQSLDTVNTGKSHARSMAGLEYFNLKSKKSMVKMTNRESIGPLCLVTVLFFLWGFAYGLLDVLNSQFQRIVHMSTGQSIGLHSAYFGAYFIAPLTFGQVVFKKRGFKATFMTGLLIYGCGTLVFWPSAVLASFPAFLISNFIVGLGVATLEIAGNPFIALCGPLEYAEIRLNISQAVQAIGSVVSPILAQKALFKSIHDAPSLINIQWTYLGIALFVVVLALIYYYLPIPEASDEDLEEVAQQRASVNHRKVCGLPVVYITLAFGVISQFCYVGGQEAVSVPFRQYIDIVRPNLKIGSFYYQAIGHTVFAVGRFLSAFAGLFISPSWILLFLFAGLIVTSALAMTLTGYAGVAMIISIYLFESGIFSIIFAMSLRGLGAYTKTGSIFMTAAISGGAVIPGIMSPITSSLGIQHSFCIIVAVFAFGALLPFYTILVPAAKEQVDPIHLPQDLSSTCERPVTSNRLSKAFSTVVRRRKRSSHLQATSHVENKHESWPG